MRKTFTNVFWILLLAFKFNVICAQCPTQGIPANTPKGNFEIDYLGTKTIVNEPNSSKVVSICANSNFTITDKSGLTGIMYWFGTGRSTLPTPPNGYINRSTITIPSGGAGKYVLLQISYNATTKTVKSYACQTIEVKAPPASPVFSLSTCKNLEVTLEIPVNSSNAFDSYVVSWGDNQTETITKAQVPLTNKKHIYATAGARVVTITGKKTGGLCDAASSKIIQPNGKSTFTPTIFTLAVQDNDTTRLQYFGGDYTYDFLQKGSTGNYQKVKTLVNPPTILTTQKFAVKDANKEQYCYKISATDACMRVSFSDSICSIPFQVTTLNKKTVLKWKSVNLPRFQEYRVSKNNNLTFQRINKVATDTYTDTPVTCGITYTYQITAVVGSITSVSRSIAVVGVDSTKPPVITNVFTTVDKGKVNITTAIPTGQTLKNYIFSRWRDSKLETFYTGNGTKAIDDKSEPANRRECYKVAYENGCGMISDTSAAFCPVFLTLDGPGIKWTEYQKYPQGLGSYYVEKLDDNGGIVSSTKVDMNLKFEPDPANIDPANPIVKFRVRAEATNKQNSYSNEVLYAQKLLLFLPDAFTPNNDGLNNIFEVKGIFIKEFKMRIYNRAGNVVFETEDYKNGWDGTYDNSPVPEGQYYYEIRATDYKGELTKRSGQIVVIR